MIKSRILCKSLAGNSVHILTISNPSKNNQQSDDRKKKMILITARVHPGETNASWMMKGFLDYVLSNDSDANTLRDNFIFKVIPMLNPDGVIGEFNFLKFIKTLNQLNLASKPEMNRNLTYLIVTERSNHAYLIFI